MCEIFPRFLQKELESVTKSLLHHFRSCLALDYIPIGWREVRAAFFPKPGCSMYNEVKNSKVVLSKGDDRHVRKGLLHNMLLDPNQQVCQIEKSTKSSRG